MPVRPINRDDEIVFHWHEFEWHLGPGAVVQAEQSKEALGAPIVRAALSRCTEGVGDFSQVDRRHLDQGEDEGNGGGDVGAISVQLFLQHGLEVRIVMVHSLVLRRVIRGC